MFSKAKNIDTAFRYIRVFTLVIVAGCLSVTCFSIYQSQSRLSQMQSKIYILSDGKILQAQSSQRSDNIPVEARDHIATFHRLFFTLDPDEKVIAANVSQALYLADATAKKQYDNLKESGFYTGIISGNISQQLSIDSIEVSTDDYPYFFTCTALQRIIRPTSIVSRRLVTSGYLRSISRSDNNPHGFLIERWATLKNEDIGVQNR